MPCMRARRLSLAPPKVAVLTRHWAGPHPPNAAVPSLGSSLRAGRANDRRVRGQPGMPHWRILGCGYPPPAYRSGRGGWQRRAREWPTPHSPRGRVGWAVCPLPGSDGRPLRGPLPKGGDRCLGLSASQPKHPRVGERERERRSTGVMPWTAYNRGATIIYRWVRKPHQGGSFQQPQNNQP